jgi:hypothetical protein
VYRCELDAYDLGYGPMAGFCEHMKLQVSKKEVFFF